MVNVLEFTFINMAVVTVFTGYLINHFERYLPAFIIKSFRYGCFAYQGPSAEFVKLIEIPKAWYRHFYIFASIFSFVSWLCMYAVYFHGFGVSDGLRTVLRMIMPYDQPAVPAMAAFIAMTLLTLQCIRRFYETQYLQVFAKASKMNLSHYAVGMIHYFGCVVAIIGEAPLFCGDQDKNKMTWIDTRTTLFAVPCILLFLWAWHEQYQTNIILANLRKDKKSGQKVTEEYGLPSGRLFEHVSSPHRMCEMYMYSVLLILVPTSTFICIYCWVIGNQIQTAIQAHEWYKKTFKNYPQTRTAVFPRLL